MDEAGNSRGRAPHSNPPKYFFFLFFATPVLRETQHRGKSERGEKIKKSKASKHLPIHPFLGSAQPDLFVERESG